MKVLACGDLHITKKKPENRMDDYWATVLNKFAFILETAEEHGCTAILQPGDFFDAASVPYDVTGNISKLIHEKYTGDFFSIVGQHDLWFHNLENINTPHFMLQSGESIIVPKEAWEISPDVFVYGAPWGSDIPEITTPGKFNILLIHEMIVKNKKNLVWSGQDEFVESTDILKEHDFDLIVSGDNHQGFTVKGRKKVLLNCGAMLRSTTAQGSHKPFVVVVDTEDVMGYKVIHYPIAPFAKIMDMEKKERNEIRDEKLNQFIEGLKATNTDDTELDFQNNVKALMDSRNVSETTKQIIQGIFEGD